MNSEEQTISSEVNENKINLVQDMGEQGEIQLPAEENQDGSKSDSYLGIQPGDPYYLKKDQSLSTYPLYIDSPTEDKDKSGIKKFTKYSLKGTDTSATLFRRYSEFFALYEKLLARWPGLYVPRIPPKQLLGSKEETTVKYRMRLLNKFLLNISKISYLYNSEEMNVFKTCQKDTAAAIKALPELSYGAILPRFKEAFPEDDFSSFDIKSGHSLFEQFNTLLKGILIGQTKIWEMTKETIANKNLDQRIYLTLITKLKEYEGSTLKSYADDQENKLLFNNPINEAINKKLVKSLERYVNPQIALRDYIEEEILETEAMQEAIKRFNSSVDTLVKLRQKQANLEAEIKKLDEGKSNQFLNLFQKPELRRENKFKDKEDTVTKINDLTVIIQIAGTQLMKKIDAYKEEKYKKYYKLIKLTGILERHANNSKRDFWAMIRKGVLALIEMHGANVPVNEFGYNAGGNVYNSETTNNLQTPSTTTAQMDPNLYSYQGGVLGQIDESKLAVSVVPEENAEQQQQAPQVGENVEQQQPPQEGENAPVEENKPPE